jgi:hypothetical protein
MAIVCRDTIFLGGNDVQFYYGEKMPLRVLDEVEFWKQQEAEHTVVIRELAPSLEPQFVTALQQWEQAFSQTNAAARRYIETEVRSRGNIRPEVYRDIMQLVDCSLSQSHQFVQFLNFLAAESAVIKSNLTVITVLNHIRRESEYFIGIAQTVLRK